MFMKSKISFALFLSAMVLVACKKENDIGIQIDGNGKPVATSVTSGTSLDPSGKPDAATDNIGIQIDGNGRPVAIATKSGKGLDPSGKPSARTSKIGTCIDPNGAKAGKGTATSDYGIVVDPDGKPTP